MLSGVSLGTKTPDKLAFDNNSCQSCMRDLRESCEPLFDRRRPRTPTAHFHTELVAIDEVVPVLSLLKSLVVARGKSSRVQKASQGVAEA